MVSSLAGDFDSIDAGINTDVWAFWPINRGLEETEGLSALGVEGGDTLLKETCFLGFGLFRFCVGLGVFVECAGNET